jgi:hypothetical protein
MIGTEAASIRRRLIMVAAAIILAIDIAQISTER